MNRRADRSTCIVQDVFRCRTGQDMAAGVRARLAGRKNRKVERETCCATPCGERIQLPGALMVIDDPAGLAQSRSTAPGRIGVLEGRFRLCGGYLC